MKYGNKKKKWFGRTFDSISEWKRFLVLKALEDSGEIEDLTLQKKYEFYNDEGNYQFAYIADFTYLRDSEEINEDVKNPFLYFSNDFTVKKNRMHEEGNILICVPSIIKYLYIASESLEEECIKYWENRAKQRDMSYNRYIIKRKEKKHDGSRYKISNYL